MGPVPGTEHLLAEDWLSCCFSKFEHGSAQKTIIDFKILFTILLISVTESHLCVLLAFKKHDREVVKMEKIFEVEAYQILAEIWFAV